MAYYFFISNKTIGTNGKYFFTLILGFEIENSFLKKISKSRQLSDFIL